VRWENVQLAALAAAVGAVRAQGPRGVGSAGDAIVTYSPAGYNHVYATWEVDAAGSGADFTLGVADGYPLESPVFVVHDYTSGAPPASLALDGAPAVAGVDYFATLEAANQRLWLTVPRTVASTLQVELTP
jgi:hypothetical protein